jgi:hypothetical protein
VDAPASAVVVTDVELLAAYVASVADLYAPEVGVAWDRVVEKVRSLAGEEVARDGALRWPTHVGAFLCR